MKYLITLGLLGLLTVSTADFFPDQDSVYINGQEYRPVQNDYNPIPSYRDNQRDSNQYSPPQENCWYEQVAITNTTDESPNIGGGIVGGIIGGVIGHQFGGGSGNTAATIGGAALGTVLGSKPQPTTRYQTVRKCR